MQPSISLPGTFEADDVNSMQLHTPPPAPRATQAAGLVGAGRDTCLGRGLFCSKNFGSNIWIRVVANRVNWSKERVRLSLISRELDINSLVSV